MSRSIARASWVLLAAGLAAAGLPARSSETTHRVRPGESASAIARQYYGSYDAADLLLQYNGRSDTLLRVGETLRVPYAEIYEVAPGDSWSGIAKGRLGRVSAYAALAALNGLPVEAPLRVGSRIVIPVVFEHRLRRGESLAALAERFYGDPSLAGVVQDFNGIEDPRRLSVGQAVDIPVVALRLAGPAGTPSKKPPRPPAAARASAPAPVEEPLAKPEAPKAEPAPAPEPAVEVEPAPAPPPPRRFEADLAAAATAWREGRYDGARRDLEAVRAKIGAEDGDADRIELFRLLAFVYVAFDLDDQACAAWAELTAVDPGARLDPDLVSPKIRATVARCRPPALASRARVDR